MCPPFQYVNAAIETQAITHRSIYLDELKDNKALMGGVCVFGGIWSFSFNNIWRRQKTEHETRQQAQGRVTCSSLYNTHTHTHGWDKTEAFWHFKDGSDGKWDCVRQSGKCHWSNCSMLLIKKHVTEREKKKGDEKNCETEKDCCLSFQCNTVRKKEACYFDLCHYTHRSQQNKHVIHKDMMTSSTIIGPRLWK